MNNLPNPDLVTVKKEDFIKGLMGEVIKFMKLGAIEYAFKANLTDDQSKTLFEFCDHMMRDTEGWVKKI